MIQEAEAEVISLEKQLVLIESRKDNDDHANGKILDYLLHKNNEIVGIANAQASLQPILDPVQPQDDDFQMSSLANILGLRVHQSSSSLVELDHGIYRRYLIQGTSYSIPFSVEFDVDETELCITRTKVGVPLDFQTALQPLITIFEKDKAVQIFFRNFNKFAEINEKRAKMYEHFKEEYPEFVTLPHGKFSTMLHFYNRKNEAFRFQILWTVKFSREGQAVQNIRIFPRMAKSVIEEMKPENIAQRFDSLVQEKGLQCAVEVS